MPMSCRVRLAIRLSGLKVKFESTNLRSGLRPERANTEKLNIGRKVIALRGGEPGDPLTFGAGQRGVEDAELDSLDIGGVRGRGGGGGWGRERGAERV